MPRASSAGQAPFFSPRGSSARCRKRSAKLRRGLINALFPKEDSFPLRSELINLLQGLRCDLPPVFLDLDLGEMLLRTDLPPNFTTDDIRWPWPGLRLMMPKQLALSAEVPTCPLQYLDICLAQENELVRLQQETLDDSLGGLSRLGASSKEYLAHGFTHGACGGEFYGSGLTDRPSEGFSFETSAGRTRGRHGPCAKSLKRKEPQSRRTTGPTWSTSGTWPSTSCFC